MRQRYSLVRGVDPISFCVGEQHIFVCCESRPTVNPNIGFCCALLAWEKAVKEPPRTLQAWVIRREHGKDAAFKITGARWPMRSFAVDEAGSGSEVLRNVIAAATNDDADGVYRHCLVFQRGTRAACWIPLQACSEAETAAAVCHNRLCLFHHVQPDAPFAKVYEDQEDDQFWNLLCPQPAVFAVTDAGPTRDELQMQAATLQHLLSELLLTTVMLADGTHSIPISPRAVAAAVHLQSSQPLLVSPLPETLAGCEAMRAELLGLLCNWLECTSSIQRPAALAALHLPLNRFAHEVLRLGGDALLRAEEKVFASILQTAHELISSE